MQQNILFVDASTLYPETVLDLESIVDPYEGMHGANYEVKILSAKFCRRNRSDAEEDIEFDITKENFIGQQGKQTPLDQLKMKYYPIIAFEFEVVAEKNPGSKRDKFRFKGRKLYLTIMLTPARIWLLKNLCSAADIGAKQTIGGICNLLVGKHVEASIVPHYDIDFDMYFHTFRRFRRRRGV